MKNIKLKITLSGLITGAADTIIDTDVLLSPFYANPEDVLSAFFEEGSEEWVNNFEKIINLIFLGSKTFDRIVKSNSIVFPEPSTIKTSTAEQYAICYATYWAGIKLFKSNMKSVSKTKNLGDFNISYRGDSNTLPVDSIILDAKSCMDSISRYLDELSGAQQGSPKGFSFRLANAKVNENSTRRWDYMVPEFGISYAGNKRVLQDGKSYKTGAYFQYWMVGKLGYDNWGYDGQFSW